MHDVIVVGAGPAGSTTARECAEKGMSVLLLDRAAFPRDKPCGGGVTARASDLLPFDISPVVERTIRGVRFNFRQQESVTRYSDRGLVYLTQRRNLDTFLVERALDTGITLRERARVQRVSQERGHVTVHTSDGRFEGRALVAADGSNGQTAQLAGIRTSFRHQVALEGNISPPKGVPDEWGDIIGLHLGWLKGGYGWIFPKGDHLNIGVCSWKYNGPNLRESLGGLAQFYGYDPQVIEDTKGYHLSLRQADSPLEHRRVLLVGDAAGLVDPISDEGIYSAFWSGVVAARHLEEFVAGDTLDLSGYRRQVERDLFPDITVSQRFHDLCHFWPGLVVKLETFSNYFVPHAFQIIRGEQSFLQIRSRHKFFMSMVDFVSDLVRITPTLRRIAGIPNPAPAERFFGSVRKNH